MNRLSLDRSLLALALLAVWLTGCAGAPDASSRGATFVVVRHAEKANDGSKDPPLAPAGQARAQALATALRDATLAAAYATAYQRTQMTALPSAQTHGLAVTTYDAQQPAAVFAAQLRRDYPTGTILVVGHSNTAPDIAAALCNCVVAPMGDDEYDRRLTIRFNGDGKAALREDRY
ncbi:MAG TPA: phosphoglycerate mutase family protein [Lysobacter sp.]|nr:phosphoglycerate mutase family protein [Lysobacter sp.]